MSQYEPAAMAQQLQVHLKRGRNILAALERHAEQVADRNGFYAQYADDHGEERLQNFALELQKLAAALESTARYTPMGLARQARDLEHLERLRRQLQGD